MNNGAVNLFKYLLTSWLLSLQIFCPFFSGGLSIFFLIDSYELVTSPRYEGGFQVDTWQVFIHSLSVLTFLTLLKESFDEQKF